jgi:hypothetical protein
LKNGRGDWLSGSCGASGGNGHPQLRLESV